jgi:transcriptional antiterminator Rof (Rho-off)
VDAAEEEGAIVQKLCDGEKLATEAQRTQRRARSGEEESKNLRVQEEKRSSQR